jgi:taurine transport system permease protein
MLRFQDARPLAATPRPRPGRAAKGASRSAQILLPIVLFGAVWWLVTELQIWEEVFVPRPAAVWDRFIQSVTTHDGNRGLSDYFLWEHLWASLWRIIQGIGWALVVGVPLGLALATVRPFAVVVGRRRGRRATGRRGRPVQGEHSSRSGESPGTPPRRRCG